MSNENQETIADIVREMHTLGRLDEKSTDKIPRTLQALGLRTYADRIEAAHSREIAELERKVAELRGCLRMAVVNARIARTCYAFGRECDNCGQSCNARKWNKVIEATKGAEDEDK